MRKPSRRGRRLWSTLAMASFVRTGHMIPKTHFGSHSILPLKILLAI